jgi:sugar phosphate isomerase/epimerase
MFFGSHLRRAEDVDTLKNIGLDFGEVAVTDFDADYSWLPRDHEPQRGGGFFVVAHGPREGPPNDLDNLRGRYAPALMKCVDVVHSLGLDFLTIHMWLDARFVGELYIQEKIRVLSELVSYAEERSVNIALENLSEHAHDLIPVVQRIPNLGITLDVGHGQLLASRNTSFEIIKELSVFIRHVHVHDNLGGSGVKDDLHLALGDGVIDFRAIFSALLESGYDRTITLEVESRDLKRSLEKLKAVISGL